MADDDLFLQTIEAAYAGGVESECLTAALDGMNRLLGGVGAVLESFDKRAFRPIEVHSVGVPDLVRVPYVEQFATLNPRLPHALRLSPGDLIWDYQILNEDEMNDSPFFSEFLDSLDMRYCLGTLLENSEDRLVPISVQRTKKQGHPEKREIAILQRLYPHFQKGYDVARRLQVAGQQKDALENALNWVADGVALLRADGNIVYANDTMLAFAQRRDGFRIAGSTIEFLEAEARRRFAAAIGAITQLGNQSSDAIPTDFAAARDNEMPAYIVSIRPLIGAQSRMATPEQAVVMVFIRDPLQRNAGTTKILQELFGLTNAEAHLAQALCTGLTTNAYANQRGVSLNTVYSHLKRIREKTGCNGVPDLIRKFGELNVPLRLG